MRIVQFTCGAAALLAVALAPAYADPPHGHPAPPKATTGSHETHGNPHAAKPPTPHPAKPPATIAQHIEAHPQLASRLQPLLPTGMTLENAAAGFKNQGQFIAALHVSHNLDIPFAQLKAEMTGKDHDSLGQAIHELRPNANAKNEAHRAEKQAKADLKSVKRGDHDNDDR